MEFNQSTVKSVEAFFGVYNEGEKLKVTIFQNDEITGLLSKSEEDGGDGYIRIGDNEVGLHEIIAIERLLNVDGIEQLVGKTVLLAEELDFGNGVLPKGTKLKGGEYQGDILFELVDEKDKELTDKLIGEREPFIQIDPFDEESEFYAKVILA